MKEHLRLGKYSHAYFILMFHRDRPSRLPFYLCNTTLILIVQPTNKLTAAKTQI